MNKQIKFSQGTLITSVVRVELAGAATIVAGCAAFIGWWWHVIVFDDKNVPTPLLALTWLLCGAALLLFRSTAPRRRIHIARFACAGALAGVALIEALYQKTIPIPVTPNLILSGTAMLLLGVQWRGVSLSQVLILPVVVGSLLTFVEYFYDVYSMSQGHALLAIGIVSKVVSLIVSSGILVVHPRQQPMATLLSKGIGGYVLRRLLPAVLLILLVSGWLRIAGQNAGLFGPERGTALVIMFIAVCTSAVLWWGACVIDRIDASRSRTKHELHVLNEELERRVAERTAQLEAANRELRNEIEAGELAREALRMSERSYRFLFEGNPLPLCVFDHQTLRYTEVNNAFLQQYGYSREEFIGMGVDRILPPEEMERLLTQFCRLQFGHSNLGLWRSLRKDGATIDIEVFHHMVLLEGRPHGIVLPIDVTERRKAEEALQNYTARLQILSRQLLNVQEAERCRIARELHDHIGQTLTAVKLGVQSVRTAVKDAKVVARLEDTIQMTAQVLEQVRSLSLDLRPPLLDELGLVAALDSHIRKHAYRTSLEVHFDAEALPVRLPSEVATACFRVVQEALTNVMRHAEANHVWISLKLQDDALRLRVTDDGKGYDAEVTHRQTLKGKSIGLLSMTERATLIGGRCEIVSSPGTGTSVRASFPLGPSINLYINKEVA